MIKKWMLSAMLMLFSSWMTLPRTQWQSAYVQWDGKGNLKYTSDSLGNKLPDFSLVGYNNGAGTLPYVPAVLTVTPGEGDDGSRIQEAIDKVAKMPQDGLGFRGAVLLKKGTYEIGGTIRIQGDGIVLRGEGTGTTLVATGRGQRALIMVGGKGSLTEKEGTRILIADAYVPVGARSFSLTSTKGLKAGDSIVLYRPGTQQWIHDLKMDAIEKRDDSTKQWNPQEYDLHFERVITRIERNKIYIDNPVMMAMEKMYGGGSVYRYSFPGRIRNIGVEYLECVSEYRGETDEDHGWNAVLINRAMNGWVRGVTAKHFGYSCVNLGDKARNITVDSCSYLQPKSQITGSRRYSFNNDGQLNLFKNCFASEGRHDYVTGARVLGPNVFYNCRSDKAKADIGPHHRWAVGTLYDNIITDGEINIQDRGNCGTGHGWSGVTQILWNCEGNKICVQNPWVSGKNYAIGVKGKKVGGRLPGRPDGIWEGHNSAGLQPVSLYAAQVAFGNQNNRNKR